MNIAELALCAQRDVAAFPDNLAGGHVQVFVRELVSHDADRQAQGLEPARIEIHLNLTHLTAVDLHRRDAVDLLDQRLQIILDDAPGNVRGLGRAHRVHHDRQCGDVEALDGRILDVLRQLVANRGDLLTHLRRRLLRIDFEAQLDADAGERFARVRFDALDAVDTRHRVFDWLRDQRLDFLRRGARVDHRDVDEGEVDVGKQIDAEPRHRDDAEHHEGQDDHCGEDGPFD